MICVFYLNLSLPYLGPGAGPPTLASGAGAPWQGGGFGAGPERERGREGGGGAGSHQGACEDIGGRTHVPLPSALLASSSSNLASMKHRKLFYHRGLVMKLH